MAKKIGAVDQINYGDVHVEQLDGVNNKQAAQAVADYFSDVCKEYSPLDLKVAKFSP